MPRRRFGREAPMEFHMLGAGERPGRRHRCKARLVDNNRESFGCARYSAQARLRERPVDRRGRRAAEGRHRHRPGYLADHQGRIPHLRNRSEIARPNR